MRERVGREYKSYCSEKTGGVAGWLLGRISTGDSGGAAVLTVGRPWQFAGFVEEKRNRGGGSMAIFDGVLPVVKYEGGIAEAKVVEGEIEEEDKSREEKRCTAVVSLMRSCRTKKPEVVEAGMFGVKLMGEEEDGVNVIR
ncbi:hypothetical protein HAX54_008701, partial [Datura stramonium]|nr:hypothetical protein [Datura stramonium]